MKYLIILLKAILIGFISCAVPGLSALTFAIVLCIYFPLVEALSNIFKNFKKNALFLLFFFVGYAIGAVLAASIVTTLSHKYPLIIICIIFGFILGSLPKMIKDTFPYYKKMSCWIVFLLVVAIFLVFQSTIQVHESINFENINIFNYLIVALIGFIISFSFAFPGFDYKILLLSLGFYYPVMNAINNLSTMQNAIENLFFLGSYLLGYLVGIFLLSKFIRLLNIKYPGQIRFACLALVLVSPYMIVREQIINSSNFSYNSTNLIIGIILGVMAFIIVFLLNFLNNPNRSKEEAMNNKNILQIYINAIFSYPKRRKLLKQIKKAHKNELTFPLKYEVGQNILSILNEKANIIPIVEGQDKLNSETCLYVVNHQGKFDSIALLSALKDYPTRLVVNKDYFTLPYSKELLKLLECTPINMDDNDIADQMSLVIEGLKEGYSYAIFIQRGNVEKNSLQYFRSNILDIAYSTKVKIIPVLLYDSYLIYQKDYREMKQPQIHFLDPIYYDEYKDLSKSNLAKIIKNKMAEEIDTIKNLIS